jgi:hypothetical protein
LLPARYKSNSILTSSITDIDGLLKIFAKLEPVQWDRVLPILFFDLLTAKNVGGMEPEDWLKEKPLSALFHPYTVANSRKVDPHISSISTG